MGQPYVLGGKTCEPTNGARTWFLRCGYASIMTTWEYATVPLMEHVTKQILDTWGSDGWELVTVIPGPTGGLVAYFKRPLS